MTDDPGVHDFSRLDAHLASVRRTALLHSIWRPLLAGAVGAALVIGAVWVTLPKFSTREVIVDHVVQTDVAVDHVVPRDVLVDHVVPKDLVVDIPRLVTPAEKAFIDSPAFSNAEIKGRIIPSPDGISLAFDTGKSWVPTDPSRVADSAPYVGLWGYCAPIIGTDRFHCYALMPDGRVANIPQKPAGRPT